MRFELPGAGLIWNTSSPTPDTLYILADKSIHPLRKDPDEEPQSSSPPPDLWISKMITRRKASSVCPTHVSFDEGQAEGSAMSDAAGWTDGSLSLAPSELFTGNCIVGSEGFR